MAKKDYSNVLKSAQDEIEKQSKEYASQSVQNRTKYLSESQYADLYRNMGLLNDTQTGNTAHRTVDSATAQLDNIRELATPRGVEYQLPDNSSLTHNFINNAPTSNSTLNSFLVSEQNRAQRQRGDQISSMMREGANARFRSGTDDSSTIDDVLNTVTGQVQTNQNTPLSRVMEAAERARAVETPGISAVTSNRGITADSIRGQDKLRNDGRNYSTINQTDNDPMRNSRIDKILDSLDYIRAKGANALEGAYQNLRAVDTGLSNAASAIGGVFKANAGTASNGLKTPNLNPFFYTNNRPVMQSSANSEGRIKSQDEFSETAGASNLRGKIPPALTLPGNSLRKSKRNTVQFRRIPLLALRRISERQLTDRSRMWPLTPFRVLVLRFPLPLVPHCLPWTLTRKPEAKGRRGRRQEHTPGGKPSIRA